jgi:hypothetical protein
MLCSAPVVLTLLCALTAGAAPPGRSPLDRHRSFGVPKTYRNLTLIPVYDTAARSTARYLTLDEGLKRKLVKVKEAGDGGDVNRLLVSNLGDDPLYIMSGEIVLGGQQDRCMGADTIIPARKKNVPVTVFCVEHGRWDGRAEFGGSAKTVASAGIRASVQEGAFAAGRPAAEPAVAAPARQERIAATRNVDAPVIRQQSAARITGDVNMGSRAASRQPNDVGTAQQRVWDQVASKNSRFKTSNATGTYRDVLNLSGGETQKRVAPYLRALSGGFGSDPQLVGVVAGVNGKVATADLFGDPALFRKLWPKLLRSYAQDAAESASVKGQQPTPVTADQARDFLLAASRGASSAGAQAGGASSARVESKSALLYRIVAEDRKAPRPAGGAGAPAPGGSGKALHENFIRK